MNDNSLDRISEIQGELLRSGAAKPHVPLEGRLKIHAALKPPAPFSNGTKFNGAHAFIRDEGPRVQPSARPSNADGNRPGKCFKTPPRGKGASWPAKPTPPARRDI